MHGQFDERVGLLEELEQGFFKQYQADSATAHQTTYQPAVTLMQSKEAKAFDLITEAGSPPSRPTAAASSARAACWPAGWSRSGVPFVEVTLGGWDTHQDNFDRGQEPVGPGRPGRVSALVTDLKERGLLDSTLVIWMGEFGRTPKINSRGAKPGRDHYPQAWSRVMFGGGIKGGQVIGKTDKEGADRRGTQRSPPSTSWPRSARSWASTTRKRTRRRSAGRSASSTRAPGRSNSSSREKYPAIWLAATRSLRSGARCAARWNPIQLARALRFEDSASRLTAARQDSHPRRERVSFV